MLKAILEKSRFIVIVPVLGSLIGAIALIGLGVYEIVELLLKLFHGGVDSKSIMLGLIEIVDGFLMSTVFLLISVGLYELFIDSTLEVPDWLEIRSLNDLKAKLIGVVIIVLGVLFLGNTARWTGGADILYLGAGIGAVIAALTFFVNKTK